MKSWAEQAEALTKKDDGYLLNQLDTINDSWLDAEEDLLTPLKQFLNGNQKAVYDQVKAFETHYGDEFADLPADLVQPLRELLSSDKPYAGGLIPQANNAMAELQKQLEQRLQQAQADALQQITEQEAQLKTDADFHMLDAEQQAQVLAPTAQAKADVQGASSKPGTALEAEPVSGGRGTQTVATLLPWQLQRTRRSTPQSRWWWPLLSKLTAR